MGSKFLHLTVLWTSSTLVAKTGTSYPYRYTRSSPGWERHQAADEEAAMMGLAPWLGVPVQGTEVGPWPRVHAAMIITLVARLKRVQARPTVIPIACSTEPPSLYVSGSPADGPGDRTATRVPCRDRLSPGLCWSTRRRPGAQRAERKVVEQTL